MENIQKQKRKIQSRRRRILAIVIIIIVVFIIVKINNGKNSTPVSQTPVESKNEVNQIEQQTNNKKDLGWELTLANPDNKISDDYKFELEDIDEYRKFDSRAIKYLRNMINDIRIDGISDIWVQSAYRSVEDQTKIYNEKVQYYKKQGKSEEDAKMLTEKAIMIPGCSDHNLGLAVDFNYVDEGFDDTKAFRWLVENAENYGFILRYPKDKEDITKVKYEPWHWRYVGKENAKKMNELKFCLEEYVEYLNK